MPLSNASSKKTVDDYTADVEPEHGVGEEQSGYDNV